MLFFESDLDFGSVRTKLEEDREYAWAMDLSVKNDRSIELE